MNDPTTVAAIDRYNRMFYERCWQAASLVSMPGVAIPSAEGKLRIEVGCGLRPRLALRDALFIDVSATACAKLRVAGADVVRATAEALPLRSATVAQAFLFDVLEHIHDDAHVVRELARVIADDGWLIISAPLHLHWWHEYDRAVGHARRYEAGALIALLEGGGFQLQAFAPFGMRPRSQLLARLGAYYLTHWPDTAFRFQERFLRWANRQARPLTLRWAGVQEFLTATAQVDGVVTAWQRCRVRTLQVA